MNRYSSPLIAINRYSSLLIAINPIASQSLTSYDSWGDPVSPFNYHVQVSHDNAKQRSADGAVSWVHGNHKRRGPWLQQNSEWSGTNECYGV